jgi:hypothetical protein
VVGNRVTIKNGVQLWDGLRAENDVFIRSTLPFASGKTVNFGDRVRVVFPVFFCGGHDVIEKYGGYDSISLDGVI